MIEIYITLAALGGFAVGAAAGACLTIRDAAHARREAAEFAREATTTMEAMAEQVEALPLPGNVIPMPVPVPLPGLEAEPTAKDMVMEVGLAIQGSTRCGVEEVIEL